jgi:TadE-like protein
MRTHTNERGQAMVELSLALMVLLLLVLGAISTIQILMAQYSVAQAARAAAHQAALIGGADGAGGNLADAGGRVAEAARLILDGGMGTRRGLPRRRRPAGDELPPLRCDHRANPLRGRAVGAGGRAGPRARRHQRDARRRAGPAGVKAQRQTLSAKRQGFPQQNDVPRNDTKSSLRTSSYRGCTANRSLTAAYNGSTIDATAKQL